jgi:hypothetical protein
MHIQINCLVKTLKRRPLTSVGYVHCLEILECHTDTANHKILLLCNQFKVSDDHIRAVEEDTTIWNLFIRTKISERFIKKIFGFVRLRYRNTSISGRNFEWLRITMAKHL